MGFTLGYQINDNIQLTFGYKSTVNDSAPGDLKMDQFMISLVFGWHPLVKGMRRLKGEKSAREAIAPLLRIRPGCCNANV